MNHGPTKQVTLPFTQAGQIMAAILGTQQAQVCRVPRESAIDLVFKCAVGQMFSLTIVEERVLSAKILLIEGREPTDSAMSFMNESTPLDTVRLFRGLESGEMLAIEVVADGGYSLNREVVERLHIEAINDTFAHIIDALMMLDVAPTEDVGDRVEPLRLALTKSLFVRMAA